MKAFVFHGPGQSAWEEVPDPAIKEPTDAVVRVDAVTICGTDLHILKGDVPEVRPGGHVANIGVHGKPATLHLEDLWIKNVTITTGLVDTHSTPTLLRMAAASRLPTAQLVTHTFPLDHMAEAYDVFGRAADTGALKVVLGGEQHKVAVRGT
ncbi:alcohol dehydrogenase catalytic domain-containing protein [Streptomyces sp. NPDC002763]|uniref:alcohol dehydrogenase catalytic domain-containing protein n=1 Tax=Streptomyces sp. NPDC002763 TaxID=3154427 RepID=UPI003318CF3D